MNFVPNKYRTMCHLTLQNQKILLFITLLIGMVKTAQAQTPIGELYDINGMPFHGYYDPLIYSPKKKIVFVFDADNFEKGYYYTSLGKKVEGEIKLKERKIIFRKNKKEIRDKIRPEEVKQFVIGVDSFFTISKFKYKGNLKKKPTYVQYITHFNKHTVVKYSDFLGGDISESYLIKADSSDVWEAFSRFNFTEKATAHFQHITYLHNDIKYKRKKLSDIRSIVKLADYQEKYENNQAIYYNQYLKEVRDSKESRYTAAITNKTDSIFTFDYYKGNQKLYKVRYSSFSPNVKHGDFVAYYPTGKPRLEISFNKNKPKRVKIYLENGELKSDYLYKEEKKKTIDGIKIIPHLNYVRVNDSLGKLIFTGKAKASVTYPDAPNNTMITTNYTNKEVSGVYRLKGTDSIFQRVKDDPKLVLKAMKNRFKAFGVDGNTLQTIPSSFDDAISESAEGMVLVRFLVNPKGVAEEAKRITSLHPQIDAVVDKFITKKHRLKVFKRGKEKHYYETVIPFQFTTNRPYRRPAYYDHFFPWHLDPFRACLN